MTFSTGLAKMVTFTSPRTPSQDLILERPVFADEVTAKILSTFSEHFNGLGAIQIWRAISSVLSPYHTEEFFYLASPLSERGLWGPWELCPKGQFVNAWAVTDKSDVGVTTISLKCQAHQMAITSAVARGDEGKTVARKGDICKLGFSKVKATMLLPVVRRAKEKVLFGLFNALICL